MDYMTREFDAFRMKMTAQYIELTRHTLADIQKNQIEMTELVKHISDTFDTIDWQIVNDAQDILIKGKIVVSDFQSVADSFKGEYKRSSQDKVTLMARYESVAFWAKQISEANIHLKDEFLRSQNSQRVIIETIIEVLNKELKKDLGFQIDASGQL